MKKTILLIAMLVLTVATFCLAADKVEAPAACQQCNMDRTKFAHSRMLVTYSDGSSSGTCSINCIVVDLQSSRKTARSFKVADYDSKKLIDARSACWVIGGKQRGVMTPVAKWAFADKKAATAFIKANGGKAATFEEVLKTTEYEIGDRDGQGKMKGHDHQRHGVHTM